MALAALPMELLEQIVADPDFQTQDLLAVALTCKSLNRVASELLYENILLDLSDADTPYKELMRVQQLARTLVLGGPALRSLVKHIHLSLCDWANYSYSFDSHLAPRSLAMPLWKGTMPNLQYKWDIDTKQQIGSVENGDLLACVRTLLSVCSDVRTLRMDGDFSSITDFWKTGHSQYPHLEQLDWINSDSNVLRSFLYPEFMEGLSQFPSLRRLRMTFRDNYRLRQLPREFLIMEHITDLVLLRSQFSYQTLRWLLSLTPNLISLDLDILVSINYSIESPESVTTRFLAFPHLRLALEGTFEEHGNIVSRREDNHLLEQLERLRISINFTYDVGVDLICLDYDGTPFTNQFFDEFMYDVWFIKSALGSLKKFSALKVLEISPRVLFGGYQLRCEDPLHMLLPDSLQELRLRDDPHEWKSSEEFQLVLPKGGCGVDTLVKLFRDYSKEAGRLPQMKKVVHVHPYEAPITDETTEESDDDVERMELVALLKSLGIELEDFYEGKGIPDW